MSFKQSNYWLDTATLPAATPGDLPARVDVAIVGAGFTGLSAARTLAKRGAKVAVLEANTIGWGASSRNGGMVLTGMKLDVETLAARYGMESAKRMYAASLASIAFVEQIVREEQIDCNFSRSGHLEVACKQSHFDAYARSVEVIGREFNHQLRVVSKKDLRSEIGSDIYFGGIVDDVSAGLNPARYVAGLGRAALAAGAAVFENARVQQISRESDNGGPGFRLNTSRGRVFARDVFIATSGYTSSATPALRKKIIPIGSFIIATEPLPDALAREAEPAQSHDLRFQALPALLPSYSRQSHVVRRPGCVLSRDRQHHPAQRRHSAARHGRGLSPIARHQTGIRLGRHARLLLRHHASRRTDGRHLLRGGIRRARRGHGNLSGSQDRRADQRRSE